MKNGKISVNIVAKNTNANACEQIVCLYRMYAFRLCNVISFMMDIYFTKILTSVAQIFTIYFKSLLGLVYGLCSLPELRYSVDLFDNRCLAIRPLGAFQISH